jgi:hypothetical protein
MSRNLDKHQKYQTSYKPNELYWGLGVEHETYIETNKLKQVTLRELKENRAQERYSVNYYSVYTPELLDKAMDGLFQSNSKILIPILLNSHTFQKTDIDGDHKTTFERIPKPNPEFSGKTIFEWMKEQYPDIFSEEYDKSFLFDGDTIEFVTQNFYNATVKDVITELETIEHRFIKALNELPREGIFKTLGPFQLAQKNHPFASYLTNLKHNAMFNNGTIHINITLPTQLNEKAEIKDFEKFKAEHQNFARVIQWLSPLLIAKYGSPDPLCESQTNGDKYAAGSQRVAVSRYIGLGTYDTETMETGKILTRNRKMLEDIDWYTSFHQKVDYVFLDELGMDINFNKHFCHGIEFRVLEAVPISDIESILKMLIYLADLSLDIQVENPKKSKTWHRIAENCVLNGKGYFMDPADQNTLFSVLNLSQISKEPFAAQDILELIVNELSEKYKNGLCVNYMIRGAKSIGVANRYPISYDSISSNELREPEITHTKSYWCCY